MVIANFVGGNEEGFVTLMNKKAKAIGMNNTVFNNPHGLDEKTKNYSTAYDMALLSIYASKIPFYQKVTGTKYYKAQTNIKSYAWTNRNQMIFTFPNFFTGKTGYTPSAGRTLVTSAKKDNLHLTIVCLDNPNHYESQRVLYDEMFKKYQNVLIISQEDFKKEYPDLFIKHDLYYPLTADERKQIDKKLLINNEHNKIVGELIISLNNKEVIKEKVFKKENNISESNDCWWKKIKDYFKKSTY